MPIDLAEVRKAARQEKRALLTGGTKLTESEAKAWCALHVGDDWYELPVMLMARGYNMDYENYTEVGADSVYELEESGCYIEPPEWWDKFELWRRETADPCVCGHPRGEHDIRFDGACWHDGGMCGCSEFREKRAGAKARRK